MAKKKSANPENQLLPLDITTDLIESEKDREKHLRSYIPSPFIAAALPSRDIKKNVFTRKYNNVIMKLSSGSKVPFGKYGRLLLTILTTHAVLCKNSNPNEPVEINYKSLNQLLKELQLPSSRSNDIKEQLACFKECSFIFEEKIVKIAQTSLFHDYLDEESIEMLGDEVKATKVSTGIIPFMKQMEYVELEDRKGNQQHIGLSIVLSKDFAQFSQEHSVPIDYTVYKNISSAIGKDLYAWLVYRNNSIKTPLFISREALVSQFMPVDDDSHPDQLRTNYEYLKEQIKIIKQKYYTDLNVEFDKAGFGITLSKSKAPMIAEDKRYILVTASL